MNSPMEILNLFYQREVERHKPPEPGSAVPRRILLKLENGVLSYVDEDKLSTWELILHRIKLFFTPSDYKIQNIKAYIDQLHLNQSVPKRIMQTINEKVSHSQENLISKIFHSIFGRKTTTPLEPLDERVSPKEISVPKPVENVPKDKFKPVNAFLEELVQNLESFDVEGAKAKLAELQTAHKDDADFTPYFDFAEKVMKKKGEEVSFTSNEKGELDRLDETELVPQRATDTRREVLNYGFSNPIAVCYMNATLQGLRALRHSFRDWLEEKPLQKVHENPLMIISQLSSELRYQVWTALVNSFDVQTDEAKKKVLQERLPDPLHALIPKLLELSKCKKTADKQKLLSAPMRYELLRFFQQLDHDAGSNVDSNSIKAFRQIIKASGSEITYEGRHEDAHDFLRHLLDSIGIQPFQFINKCKFDDETKELRPIIDRNTDVQFGIDNVKDISVQALSELPDEKVRFPSVVDIPKFLPIVLKRFEYDVAKKEARKISSPITPSTTLEVAIQNSKNVARYRLRCVALHVGSTLNGGHYVAYVPHTTSEATPTKWHCFDDTTVTEVANSDKLYSELTVLDALKQNGYIHFYELEGIVEKA